MGLQRVGHDWETELSWTELNDSDGKEPGCNAGDPDSVPGLERYQGDLKNFSEIFPRGSAH